MKGFYACFMIVLTVSFLSCEDKSTSPTSNNLNAPVITNVTNSFTYSANAKQYSDNSQNNLSFLSDSLIVTLSFTDYLSGQAIVSVRDSLNTAIFSDTLKSNKTTVIVDLKAIPRYCSIISTNLTGKLVFVVVGQ